MTNTGGRKRTAKQHDLRAATLVRLADGCAKAAAEAVPDGQPDLASLDRYPGATHLQVANAGRAAALMDFARVCRAEAKATRRLR